MDLSKIKGAFTRNKVVLGAVGVLAVAGLAWRARSTSTSTSADTASTTDTGSSYSSGAQTYSATGYDSTSSDIYNSIQPQLEALQDLYNKIPVADSTSTDATTPVVDAAAAAEAAITGGDSTRSSIWDYYETALGRTPGRSEVNWWQQWATDNGKSTDDIKAGILNSQEAKSAK